MFDLFSGVALSTLAGRFRPLDGAKAGRKAPATATAANRWQVICENVTREVTSLTQVARFFLDPVFAVARASRPFRL